MLQIQLKEANMQFPLVQIDTGYFLLKSKVTHEDLKESLDKWCEQNSKSNELQYLTSMYKAREVPKVSCPSLQGIEDRNLKSVTNFGSVKKDNFSCVFSMKEPSRSQFHTGSQKGRIFDFKSANESTLKPQNNSSSYMPSLANFGLPCLNLQMNSDSTNSNSLSNKTPIKAQNEPTLKKSISIQSQQPKQQPLLFSASYNAQENLSATLEKNEENTNNLFKTEVELDKIMRNLDQPKIEQKQEQPVLNNSSSFNFARPNLSHSGSFEVTPGPSLFSTVSNKQQIRGYSSTIIGKPNSLLQPSQDVNTKKHLFTGFSFDLKQKVVVEEDDERSNLSKKLSMIDSENEKSDFYSKRNTLENLKLDENMISQLDIEIKINKSDKKTLPENRESSKDKNSITLSIESEPFKTNIEKIIRSNNNLDDGLLDISSALNINIDDRFNSNSEDKNKPMMHEKNTLKQIKEILNKRNNQDKSNRNIKKDPTENILAGLDSQIKTDPSRQDSHHNMGICTQFYRDILESLDLTKSHHIDLDDDSAEFNINTDDIGLTGNLPDISPQITAIQHCNKNNKFQDSIDVKELLPSPKGGRKFKLSPIKNIIKEHKKSISLGVSQELLKAYEIETYSPEKIKNSSGHCAEYKPKKKEIFANVKTFSENIILTKDQKITLPSDPLDKATLKLHFTKNIKPQSQFNSMSTTPRRNSVTRKSTELKSNVKPNSNQEFIEEQDEPTPMNKELFTLDKTGVLKQWNVDTKKLTSNWGQMHQGVVKSMVIEPNHRVIFIGGGDGSLKEFNIDTKEFSFDFGKAHSKAITCMGINKDSRFLVTASEDCQIKQWCLKSNNLLKVKESAHEKEISSLVVHPFKDFIMTGSADEHQKRWDLSDNQDNLHGSHIEEICLINDFGKAHKFKVSALCFLLQKNQAPDFVFSAGDDKCIIKWDIEKNHKVNYQIDAHDDSIKALKVHENILISGGDDYKLKQWDVQSLHIIKSYGVIHHNWIRGLAIIPNIKNDQKEKISEYKTEEKICIFSVITISEDKTMKQFDILNVSSGEGKLTHDFRVCHDHPIVCIDYLT